MTVMIIFRVIVPLIRGRMPEMHKGIKNNENLQCSLIPPDLVPPDQHPSEHLVQGRTHRTDSRDSTTTPPPQLHISEDKSLTSTFSSPPPFEPLVYEI